MTIMVLDKINGTYHHYYYVKKIERLYRREDGILKASLQITFEDNIKELIIGIEEKEVTIFW